MNASALPCHCLPSATGQVHAVLRGLDVAFTCLSSACLMLATLSARNPKLARAWDALVPGWAAAAIALAVCSNAGPMRPPFLNELM